MPREFQPLLLRDLDISIEGYRIARLVLNRHTPSVDRVSRHAHDDFHQCLVYLKGRGYQLLPDAEELEVHRGSLVFVPQGMKHGFRKDRELRPLCLAVEFESGSAAKEWKISSHLNPSALKRLEQSLVRLGQLQDSGADSLSIAGTILDLLGVLRETATGADDESFSAHSGVLAGRVRGAVLNQGVDSATAQALSKDLGFSSPESLNRQLQQEGSPTVLRILNFEKTVVAKQQLRGTSKPVGEIAEQVGFLDQNYFARWFKAQTGQTPTKFRSGRGRGDS